MSDPSPPAVHPLGVTTSQAARPREVGLAHTLAVQTGGRVVERGDRTVSKLLRDEGLASAIAVGGEGPVWRDVAGHEFFFHPNMGVQRLRAVARGGVDKLVRVAGVRPGDRILDATLGLAADAMVLADAVGPGGKVVGLEASSVVAALVRHGLSTYAHKFQAALRRVRVVQGDAAAHLQAGSPLARIGWDLIYFDPMFRRTLEDSTGLDGLRALACYKPLTPATLSAARALVRRGVVVKGRPDEPPPGPAPDKVTAAAGGKLAYYRYGPQA